MHMHVPLMDIYVCVCTSSVYVVPVVCMHVPLMHIGVPLVYMHPLIRTKSQDQQDKTSSGLREGYLENTGLPPATLS